MTIPPPSDPVRLKAKAEYLRGLVRETRHGGCQVLSVTECGCPLCAIDELLKAALGSSTSPSSPSASEGHVTASTHEVVALPGDTLVHVAGLPFRTIGDTPVLGQEASLNAAIDTLKEAEAAGSPVPQPSEVEKAARLVLETFERDEAAGYRSRDRQFAIDVLGKALAGSPVPSSELERLVKEWQEASNDSTFAPSDATKRRHVAAVKALLAWGKADH